MGQTKTKIQIPISNIPNIPQKFILYGMDSLNKCKKNQIKSKCNLMKEQKFFFKDYESYLISIKLFKNSLSNNLKSYQKEIEEIKNQMNIKEKIYNSYMNFVIDINMEKLFTASMSLYHRITNIYGLSHNYPSEELNKIDMPLITKYLAYPLDNGGLVSLSDKIIKRINYLTENFPFNINRIIKIIENKCCYISGYDKEMNINLFIEPYNINMTTSNKDINNNDSNNKDTINDNNKIVVNDENKSIQKGDPIIQNNNFENSFIDYIIFITFINEIIIPSLKGDGLNFSNKMNIFISFNNKEPDSEFITFLMTQINNLYPLYLNKLHIVNYNTLKLRTNTGFMDNLNKIDFFNMIYFHNNDNYIEELKNYINIKFIPKSFGGSLNIKSFCFQDTEEDLYKTFPKYILDCIFCKE